MFRIKTVFIRLFAALFALVMLLGAPKSVPDGDEIARENDVICNVNVVSDIHMETNNKYRKNVYVQTLRNMAAYTPELDGLMMCGDNTMNGFSAEYWILNGLTARLLPDTEVLTVCGNHDVGNGDGDFDELKNRFINQYNAYHADTPVERLWYARELPGCLFISLASDTDNDDFIEFSEEEIAWFGEQLDAAGEAGLPVLVGCHYPLSYIDDAFEETILAHKNVYYFSGHLHRSGISVHRIGRDRDDLWYFNLPRVTECDEDTGETRSYTGLGVNLQITADSVTVNVYNFYTAELEDSFTAPII